MLSSLQVLYVQGFVMVWVLGQMLRKLFFGTLQAAEVEVALELQPLIHTP